MLSGVQAVCSVFGAEGREWSVRLLIRNTRYMYAELIKKKKEVDSILTESGSSGDSAPPYRVKNNVFFHLYISQGPCNS